MQRRLVVVMTVLLFCIRPAGSECRAADPPRAEVKYTVSKETTVLTAPVTEDGRVNYTLAVDQLLAADITPEENAIVMLAQAYGPGPIHEPIRESYFQRLGIEPLPEQGDYLVHFEKFSGPPPDGVSPREFERTLRDRLQTPMSRIWRRDEFPKIADWIDANAIPLKRVHQAVERSRSYSPLGYAPGESAMLMAVLFTYRREVRVTARLLGARSLLALEAGETDEAWADLYAAHRLARHFARGPTFIPAFTRVRLEEQVFDAEKALLEQGALTAPQARNCLRQLTVLPAAPEMSEVIDSFLRYEFLDAVSVMAKHKEGVDGFYTLLGDPTDDDPIREIFPAAAARADWDAALRLGNTTFDRLVAAMRLPTRVERTQALEAVSDEIELTSPFSRGRQKDEFLDTLRNEDPRAVAHALGGLMLSIFAPPFEQLHTAQDQGDARFGLLRIGLALAAYRAEHDGYPDDLDALAPGILPEIPSDPFSDRPFVYRKEGQGYVVYSVGWNTTDDGGRDKQDQPPGDDLVIRVTHTAL